MMTLVAPLAGLIFGLINVIASFRRFSRGEESAATLMRWTGLAAVLTLTGWQFRGLGLWFAIAFPLILTSLEAVYFVRERRARKQPAAAAQHEAVH
jgi:hypothetical protein